MRENSPNVFDAVLPPPAHIPVPRSSSNPFDAVFGGSAPPHKTAPAHKPGKPPVGQGFVAPPLNNVFDLLDWQRAAVAEGRFHQHSSDANMAANREAVFGPGFNEHWYSKRLTNRPEFQPGGFLAPRPGVPMSGAPKALAGLIDAIGHGAIDLPIQAAEDPLSYESFGAGPLLKNVGLPVARAVGSVAENAAAPASRALARIPAVKHAADEFHTAARDIVMATKAAWQHLTSYAPQTRAQYGGTKARESIANESVQSAEEAQIERRLQSLVPNLRKIPNDTLYSAAAALNGQIPITDLTPAARDLYLRMRGVTNAIVLLKAAKGGGAAAKISRVAARAPAQGPLRPLPLRNAASSPARELGGSASDPLTNLRQQIAELADQLREESRQAMGAPRKMTRSTKKPTLTLKAMSPLQPLKLPSELEPFRPHEGWLRAQNVRAHYAPSLHYAKEVSEDTPARTISKLAFNDPHERPREDIQITPATLPQFRDAWDGMIKAAARSVAAHRSAERLKGIFGGSIPKIVEDEIYTQHIAPKGSYRFETFGSSAKTLLEYWKQVVNLPRIGVVGWSTRHVANIFDLLANADPGAIPDAIGITRKLLTTRDPKAREDFLREATDMGLTAPFDDSKARFTPFNKLTWDFDTAAAWALAKRLLAKGDAKSPLDAGQMARELLVDYRHKDLLTRALGYAIPFATFAKQMPSATLRGVSRSLPRTATTARAFPPLYGSHTDDQGNPRPMLYYGPTAETGAGLPLPLLRGDMNGALRNVGNFVRQRLGAPTATAVDLGMRAFGAPAGVANRVTYGQDPLSPPFVLGAATSWLPFSRTALGQVGMGPFQSEPWDVAAVRTMTGLAPTDGIPTAAHTSIVNMVNGVYAGPIHDARLAGNEAKVSQLESEREAAIQRMLTAYKARRGAQAAAFPVATPP